MDERRNMKLHAIAAPILAASLALGAPAVALADVSPAQAATPSSQVIALQKSGSTVSLAAAKNGLVKKGSNYYFYQNGKMVKKAWKTYKKAKYYFQKNGKAAIGSCKVGSKYYIFDKKGKLAKGSKTRVVTVKNVKYQVTKAGVAKSGWNAKKTNYFQKSGAIFTNGTKKIGSKTYCFGSKGALIKGDGLKQVSKNKFEFLCASNAGVYDAARTGLLKSYCVENKECSGLLSLLGAPISRQVNTGCHFLDGALVDDVTYKFPNFTLATYIATDGTERFYDLYND